jgi:hypothetical protein
MIDSAEFDVTQDVAMSVHGGMYTVVLNKVLTSDDAMDED